MKLEDLIDLEVQLSRDRDADPAAVESRDRALLSAAGAPPQSREVLLERWLEALRQGERDQIHPGAAVATALRGVRAALAIAGVVLGWGAATALLRYDGRQPVNVWDFLLVFVGVQLLLLALLLSSFFLPLAAIGAPIAGLFRGALAAIYPRIAGRALGWTSGRVAEWRALWHRLRSRRSLYHRVEPWLLLGLTQTFGVAFNAGALFGCLRLIVFSDIAFSWSTTLIELDAARFHGIVHALAAPFAWIWPDADPSIALVEATRYSRLEGAYLLSGGRRAAHPEIVGGWWPFLIASLAFYGLLPRCITFLVARLRSARLLSRMPLDDVEVTRALHRLSEPHVETVRSSPEEPPRAAGGETAPAAPIEGGTPCTIVLWRDVPARPALQEAVARQTRCAVSEVRSAGGRDYDEAQSDWAALPQDRPVAVVAEGWEAPDKGVLRLLSALRRALGPRTHLLVLLAEVKEDAVLPAQPAEVRIWRQALAPLEDPYLAVEALRGAP